MICVADFHDLYLRQNRELCRKVGTMEFELYHTSNSFEYTPH